MKRKTLIFAVVIAVSLSLGIISISYGYWMDKIYISGDGAFEYHLPIENDLKLTDEGISVEEGLSDPDGEEEVTRDNILVDGQVITEEVVENPKHPTENKLNADKVDEDKLAGDRIPLETVVDDGSQLQ